jgi:single-strand DNA-binding protein
MLNNCLLTGNLGADPEVFYSSEGDPIATFNLAFRSSKKKTNWIKITCFNKLAEITEKYLHRGARIALIGTLSAGRSSSIAPLVHIQFSFLDEKFENLVICGYNGK